MLTGSSEEYRKRDRQVLSTQHGPCECVCVCVGGQGKLVKSVSHETEQNWKCVWGRTHAPGKSTESRPHPRPIEPKPRCQYFAKTKPGEPPGKPGLRTMTVEESALVMAGPDQGGAWRVPRATLLLRRHGSRLCPLPGWPDQSQSFKGGKPESPLSVFFMIYDSEGSKTGAEG